jgi:uncharacterized MAPEG superfamily protein
VNIPLLSVGVAFLLVYVPKLPLSVAMAKQPDGYDNKNPRAQQAKLTGWGERARNAHNNGFESFPGFAAAVFVAELGHADPKWSANLAITYCVARLVYPVVYMANLGMLRSAVWTIGFGATCALFALPLFA